MILSNSTFLHKLHYQRNILSFVFVYACVCAPMCVFNLIWIMYLITCNKDALVLYIPGMLFLRCFHLKNISHCSSSYNGITEIRPALVRLRANKLNKIHESTVFKHWVKESIVCDLRVKKNIEGKPHIHIRFLPGCASHTTV